MSGSIEVGSLVILTVLLIDFLLLVITSILHTKMNRRVIVVFSLAASFSALFLNLFSEYSPDLIHSLNHLITGLVFIGCVRLLVSDNVVAFIHRLNSLELNIFDKSQYFLAQTIMSFINRIRDSLELNIFDKSQYFLAQTITFLSRQIGKTQTGSLNLNIVYIASGLIMCLLLLFFVKL